jgi:hypothetical protein
MRDYAPLQQGGKTPFGPPFARVGFTGGGRRPAPASRRGAHSPPAVILQVCRIAAHTVPSRTEIPGVATWAT